MVSPGLTECGGCHSWTSSRWCSLLVRRKLGVLLAVVILTPFFVLMMVHNPDLSNERVLVERVAELRERLGAATALNGHRMQDIQLLANKFNAIMPVLNTSEHPVAALSPSASELLLNVSNPGALRLPSIYSYLPYLLQDQHSTTPAFMLSRGRMGVEMVLGVPTVKREVQSYLMTTLHNLVDSMTVHEQNTSLIIVFVAESDIDWVHKVASLVERNMAQHVASGLIEVVSPPASFYPDFSVLKPSLGDPVERVRWRTKQNLDFAFLMMYAQTKGVFYVQLEDDVQTKPGYISTMKTFALQKTAENKDWFVLDFCQLGFIGKLFRASALPPVVMFMIMFREEQPCDWLLNHIVSNRVCALDKSSKHCKKAKDKVWIRYKPSLFQHIGTHSSLKGKVQKLKDKQFGKVQLFFPHLNPPATVDTNIKPYKTFSLDRAYRGESYFWGLLPQQGDHLTFTFTSPVVMEEFLFRSGNVEHPSDRLYNTTVEVLPITRPPDGQPFAGYPPSDLPGYLVLGAFDDLGVAQGSVSAALGPVHKMKLRVHAESDNWAILSEINIKASKGR